MNDLRTAAQQALEAMESVLCNPDGKCCIDGSNADRAVVDAALTALRAALAQQAEPTVTEDMKSAVRWAPSSAYWSQRLREFFGPEAREGIDALERRLAKAQQAEPVQDQRCRAEPRSDGDFVCDCKIGGCPGRSAEPAQEPVAWRFKPMIGSPWSLSDDGYYISCKRDKGYIVEPLYTAPPQRKPLTEEEIEACRQQGYAHAGFSAPFDFGKAARAVERAHGIKE